MNIQKVFSDIIKSMSSALITVDAELCVKHINTYALQISVLDNCNAMTDEVVRKAFDPYFTTRPTSGGTGLCLSPAYRIIKTLLGGEIEISSAPKLGAQFIITLHACGKPQEQTS